MMLKNISCIILCVVFGLGMSDCHKKEKHREIRVGTISGPETQLMEVAKKVAAQRFHVAIQIVSFADYNMPNVALHDGSLDANMFQHLPYLHAQMKARGYQFVSIGKAFLYPMGLYSHKIKRLSGLLSGAKVAIPNDASNEARALLMLQKAGLITLKKGVSVTATPSAIVSNPKQLVFFELDAAQLPRALADVSLAAINTNYAISSGLSPAKDALLVEDEHSPYVNIVVARKDNQKDPRLISLVNALHSPEVLKKAKEIFGDGVIPGWFTP